MTAMTRIAGTTFALALLLLPQAARADVRGPTTFAGTCEMEGDWTVQGAPWTIAHEPHTDRIDLTGTCSGMLDGKVIHTALTRLGGTIRSEGGCLASLATADLQLRFGNHRRAPTIDVALYTINQAARLQGHNAGDAVGAVTAYTNEQPDHQITDCAAGGFRRFVVRLVVRTLTPLQG